MSGQGGRAQKSVKLHFHSNSCVPSDPRRAAYWVKAERCGADYHRSVEEFFVHCRRHVCHRTLLRVSKVSIDVSYETQFLDTQHDRTFNSQMRIVSRAFIFDPESSRIQNCRGWGRGLGWCKERRKEFKVMEQTSSVSSYCFS